MLRVLVCAGPVSRRRSGQARGRKVSAYSASPRAPSFRQPEGATIHLQYSILLHWQSRCPPARRRPVPPQRWESGPVYGPVVLRAAVTRGGSAHHTLYSITSCHRARAPIHPSARPPPTSAATLGATLLSLPTGRAATARRPRPADAAPPHDSPRLRAEPAPPPPPRLVFLARSRCKCPQPSPLSQPVRSASPPLPLSRVSPAAAGIPARGKRPRQP